MTRAVITDKGLAGRLGERAYYTKRGKDPVMDRQEGTLVFFPNCFAIKEGKKLHPIRKGGIVTLPTAAGIRRDVSGKKRFVTNYVYTGRGYDPKLVP
jgi:hypothetical protein